MLLDLQDLENGMYVINNVKYVSRCLITRNVILSCYTISNMFPYSEIKAVVLGPMNHRYSSVAKLLTRNTDLL